MWSVGFLCMADVSWFLANVHVRYNAVARPSVVCLSVTLVHPTQAVEIFHNISTAFDTLAGHPLTSTKNLTEIVPCRGTPPSGEFDTRGVARYSDFGPIEGYISETVQDRK